MKGRAYCRMIIGKIIIDTHILEEPFDMNIKEAFNFSIVELRVYKNSSYVCLNYVR
jgi:hypothetical protein